MRKIHSVVVHNLTMGCSEVHTSTRQVCRPIGWPDNAHSTKISRQVVFKQTTIINQRELHPTWMAMGRRIHFQRSGFESNN